MRWMMVSLALVLTAGGLSSQHGTKVPLAAAQELLHESLPPVMKAAFTHTNTPGDRGLGSDYSQFVVAVGRSF